MGLVKESCNGKGMLLKEAHYDKLSKEMGVEKNVFKAVAEVESGGGQAFSLQIQKNQLTCHIIRFLKSQPF